MLLALHLLEAHCKYRLYTQLVSATEDQIPMLFSIPPDIGRPFNIETVNAPDYLYPFFGGIKGYASDNADIGPGSANYIFLGGTEETPLGIPPVTGENTFTAAAGVSEETESSIWTFSKSHNITPRWINTDSSTPTGYLGYQTVDSQSALFFTGDTTEFSKKYPGAIWIYLLFVPLLS
ncbi:hypothetical protein BDZ97DRAFT_2061027 [Flammula alnicola]|nr:hypothetical protein BDZ97DRAFT_2061027 [Flammula alnicola]